MELIWNLAGFRHDFARRQLKGIRFFNVAGAIDRGVQHTCGAVAAGKTRFLHVIHYLQISQIGVSTNRAPGQAQVDTLMSCPKLCERKLSEKRK